MSRTIRVKTKTKTKTRAAFDDFDGNDLVKHNGNKTMTAEYLYFASMEGQRLGSEPSPSQHTLTGSHIPIPNSSTSSSLSSSAIDSGNTTSSSSSTSNKRRRVEPSLKDQGQRQDPLESTAGKSALTPAEILARSMAVARATGEKKGPLTGKKAKIWWDDANRPVTVGPRNVRKCGYWDMTGQIGAYVSAEDRNLSEGANSHARGMYRYTSLELRRGQLIAEDYFSEGDETIVCMDGGDL